MSRINIYKLFGEHNFRTLNKINNKVLSLIQDYEYKNSVKYMDNLFAAIILNSSKTILETDDNLILAYSKYNKILQKQFFSNPELFENSYLIGIKYEFPELEKSNSEPLPQIHLYLNKLDGRKNLILETNQLNETLEKRIQTHISKKQTKLIL